MRARLQSSIRNARFAATAGAINGLIAVACGAFGAHALRDRVPADLLAVFKTGAEYQMAHALALLGIAGLLHFRPNDSRLRLSSLLFTVGITLFSGSLYLMALTGERWLGMITPFGGLSFLLGWLLLLISAGAG